MISLVIDANVLKAIFEEDIGLPSPRPERTGPAANIANGIAPPRKIALDESGMIEYEYGDQCKHSPEWLKSWLAEGFQLGKLILVDAKAHTVNAKKVETLGFPRGSRDLWYIKTALAAREISPHPSDTHLISEDIDLYDPTKKASQNKAKTILAGKGPVAKHLKGQGITVCCIAAFNAAFS